MTSHNASCSDGEFIRLYEKEGPIATARILKCTRRNVYERRRRLEKIHRREIKAPAAHWHLGAARVVPSEAKYPGRLHTTLKDGIALIGSDSHYWPGEPSTAHRAFVKFCKDLKPKIVIKNGDELDGSSISRHPPIGWDTQPTVAEEIEAVKDRLGEITIAAGKAERYWPLGNHDARYETRLATVAPEYARVHGVSLADHFPDWQPCWSVWINEDVVVKHRFKGGIHATHNNALWSGKTVITGHLHSLKVTPLTDYKETRFGVDCGCLADPYHKAFEYLEDNPRNWRSGFVVLTFNGGRLMWPEVVHVIGTGQVEFRGRIINV